MDEIRKRDVLRLFFGKEHKHYIVEKVGQRNIKLKTEEGTSVILPHNQGKLVTLGDATVTGFKILRDPSRYNDYYIGAEVSVRTHDGKTFQGDVLENDDGMLKIKTDSGNQWYVDLDSKDKVELVGNVVDEKDLVKLPDEIDDLFFAQVKPQGMFNRVYEHFRTKFSARPLPYWVVPLLDATKCVLTVASDFQSLSHSMTVKSGGTEMEQTTECVVFNQTVSDDTVKETYVFVAGPKTKLPIVEYLVMPPASFHAPLNLINSHNGLRLSQPQEGCKRFDSAADAIAAYTPNLATMGSAFDCDVEVYPLDLKSGQLSNLSFEKKKELKEKKEKVVRPKLKHTRSTFSAPYNGRIADHLTPSETLSRMYKIDFGNTYFSKQSIFPETTDKNWTLERLTQRMKGNSSSEPYTKEAIAIQNDVCSLFSTAKYEHFLFALQQYGRTSGVGENEHYLYFSAPLYYKYKLVPVVLEQLARTQCYRGSSGLKTLLNNFVWEDNLQIDKNSGVVHTKAFEQDYTACSTDKQDISCLLPLAPSYSEDDLILLNLAHRIALDLDLNLSVDHQGKLLNAVRLYSSDYYRSACTMAAYLAHFGHVAFPRMVDVLRKAAKRKVWEQVQTSKTLVADITKAAQHMKTETKKKLVRIISTPLAVPKGNVIPVFELKQSKKTGHAVPFISYTVLSKVTVKEYNYLADVFAPDKTAAQSLLTCEPYVMNLIAPSEKSFAKYIGDLQPRLLYEFVLNVASVVPTLVVNSRPNFHNVLPLKKKNNSFMSTWTVYTAPLLTLELAENVNDVATRFSTHYKSKIPTFHRLVAVAKTALQKTDTDMLVACSVRAVYMHFMETMSEETEAYVKQLVYACVEMYRRGTVVSLV